MANSVSPSNTSRVIWDIQMVGLGLRVYPSGRKSWVFRYRLGRRQRLVSVGVFKTAPCADIRMPLNKAREVGRRWRMVLDEGKDPRVELQRRGDSIEEHWTAFIDHKETREQLSASTIRGYQSHWRAHITHKKYGISTMPARSVTRRDLIRLQRSVADRGRAAAAERYNAALEAGKEGASVDKMERSLSTAGNGAANSLMRTVSSLFGWLVYSGELDHSPCVSRDGSFDPA